MMNKTQKLLVVNPCNVVAQWVTSQPVTVDLTLTVHSAHLHIECRFPLLHGSGAGIPGIGILIYS